MKLIDVTERNAKELKTLQAKVKAFVKSARCSTGDITWHSDKEHSVQVDNDGMLGDYLSSIIEKSPNTRNVKVEEHKGEYMWSADHYVRPCTVVSFTF